MNKENQHLWLENIWQYLHQARQKTAANLQIHETGTVTTVSTGIAKISGLPSVGSQERINFANGVKGIAFNIDRDEVGVVLLHVVCQPMRYSCTHLIIGNNIAWCVAYHLGYGYVVLTRHHRCCPPLSAPLCQQLPKIP